MWASRRSFATIHLIKYILANNGFNEIHVVGLSLKTCSKIPELNVEMRLPTPTALEALGLVLEMKSSASCMWDRKESPARLDLCMGQPKE